jgi:hypothetical protein
LFNGGAVDGKSCSGNALCVKVVVSPRRSRPHCSKDKFEWHFHSINNTAVKDFIASSFPFAGARALLKLIQTFAGKNTAKCVHASVSAIFVYFVARCQFGERDCVCTVCLQRKRKARAIKFLLNVTFLVNLMETDSVRALFETQKMYQKAIITTRYFKRSSVFQLNSSYNNWHT